MANYLILNQNQVWNGLGTLTYTVASTGQYNVRVQSSFPAWEAEGNAKAGSGQGLGSGYGGGGSGFVDGDAGTGHGGVGQGFGATNSYQQPPHYGSNQTSYAGVQSSVSILVKKNGVTLYTAPVPAVVQGEVQFKTSFLASSGDSITVVLSSSDAEDNQLNSVRSNISISQGLL
jgi:hypothetical protein